MSQALVTLYRRLVPEAPPPSFNSADAGISPLTFLNCDAGGNVGARADKIHLPDVKALISSNLGLPTVLLGVEIPPDDRPATSVDRLDPPPATWGGEAALVLMLGNEGSGMTEKQLKCCDEFLFINQVRSGEHRSDELKSRVHGELTSNADTSVRIVAAVKSFLRSSQFSADTASFNVAVAWAIVAERVWTVTSST